MADNDDASVPDTVSNVLRLRGLPFTSTEDDVKEFFGEFQLQQIFLCKRNGRSNGEAYVQLDSPQAAKDALESLNRKHLGKRYIEIFEAQPSDLLAVKALSAESKAKGFVVRLRGLPYSATAADVVKFFDGIDILRGAEGVLFTFTPDGRPTGEAYAEFESDEAHKEAMKRHKEMMGTRYIELFVSSKVDMYQAMHHNKYVSQTNKKRWLMHGGAVIDATAVPAMRHMGYPGGVDEMSEFFRNFSMGPRPIVPRFGPAPGDPVAGMPGAGVGLVPMEPTADAQQGRHKYLHGSASPGRLQSPVPPRTQGLQHMGVPTYVSNYPTPRAVQGGAGGRLGQQQHLQQLMTPVDYAQQQMLMQQQMMQQHQQYLMQQQQVAWGGVGGMQGSGMPPAPGVGGSWYKGYTPPGTAAFMGGAASNGYGGHAMYGMASQGHIASQGHAGAGPHLGMASHGHGGGGPHLGMGDLQRHSGSPHSLDVGFSNEQRPDGSVDGTANGSF